MESLLLLKIINVFASFTILSVTMLFRCSSLYGYVNRKNWGNLGSVNKLNHTTS